MTNQAAIPALFSDSKYRDSAMNHLWTLFKAWLNAQEIEPDPEERKKMVCFYESLQGLVEAAFISGKTPVKTRDRIGGVLTEDTYFSRLMEAIQILIDPQSVYLFTLPDLRHGDVALRRELYVVLKSCDPTTYESFKNMMTFLVLDREEIGIHPINSGMLTRELRNGNLFFLRHIDRHTMIYRKEESTELPGLSDSELREGMNFAKKRLDSGSEKACVFWEHAAQELSNGNWGLVLYFLHQSLELHLRALIYAWEHQEKKTHETRVLLRHCYKFIPELANVFPQDTEEEELLLRTLEDAYCKARYKMVFPVDQATAELLMERGSEIRELIGKHYRHYFLPLENAN